MQHPEPQALADLLERAAAGGEVSGARAGQLVRTDPVTPVFRSVGLDPNARERVLLFRSAADLCPEVRLNAAGLEVAARMGPDELWRFYLPLCRLIGRLRGKAPGRAVVGVAGCGGSGKSVFTALLQTILNRAPTPPAPAALCPLDGFHHPNAYLEEHFTADRAGRRVSLRSLKGAPQTFDVRAYAETLRKARTEPQVRLPGYDRRLHDPVPDAVSIGPNDGIVLTEGNYLLLERGGWAPVRPLLDLALFVFLPPGVTRSSIIERHVRGGRSRREAVQHYEHSDRWNAQLILSTMHRADLVVRRSAGHRIEAVERPESPVDSAEGV